MNGSVLENSGHMTLHVKKGNQKRYWTVTLLERYGSKIPQLLMENPSTAGKS